MLRPNFVQEKIIPLFPIRLKIIHAILDIFNINNQLNEVFDVF